PHLPLLYSFRCSLRPLPVAPLFPYTTLFRSRSAIRSTACSSSWERKPPSRCSRSPATGVSRRRGGRTRRRRRPSRPPRAPSPKRSEEHTSELQSRENLVCRLLLENKKEHD